MMENEAIEELRACVDLPYGNDIRGETAEVAISALKEIQQYRALGTVEELEEMGKPSEIKVLVNRLNGIIAAQHDKLSAYAKLGTVEELQEAMENQKAKKPKINKVDKYTIYMKCQNCKLTTVLYSGMRPDFCPKCGQTIDWSEEE